MSVKDCRDCEGMEAQANWYADQADILQAGMDELVKTMRQAHTHLERAKSADDYEHAWAGWQAARKILGKALT